MIINFPSDYSSNKRILTVVLVAAISIAAPLFAVAQDNVGEESTVVYPASYFAEYAPVTAQDMMDRIPGLGSATGGSRGFSGRASSGGRGLGSGSGSNQILINGKRTAGKNNQTSGLLDRITADQVIEIQIIRGTSGDLDVRGSGQVINVLLLEELDSRSTSYELNVDRYADNEARPGGSLSSSGRYGNLNYLLSAIAEPRYSHRVSKENSVLGDFSPNDEVREEPISERTSYDLSMNLGYDINSNSSARLNGLYSINDNELDGYRWIKDLKIEPNTVLVQHEIMPSERDNWEIGGDYEYLTDAGSRFKFLFISNEFTDASTRQRYEVLDDGSEEIDLFLDTTSVTQERIARSSYTFDFLEGQNIEFGLERAQTILDSRLALGLPSDIGIPSDAYGGLVPQDVDNANSTVEEIRYEPFVIHNWVISPKMSLETTLLYEVSEIEQTGDVSNTRDFDFVKPKVDLRYDVTPQLQLRGSIEKVVNQLSFSDFVASNDYQDNDSTTQAGNANLRQAWLWKYDLNAEYRLVDDVGVVSGNIFYHDHRDVIERMDVSTSAEDLQSANGNIGDGWMYGINLNASIRMRMLNLPNLLVTSGLSVQDSEITDPFLGIDRRFAFHNRGRFSLGFRHDITRWNLNYGVSWNNRFDGNMKRYDIDDVELFAGDPMANAFVEFVDSRGMTYRFDARNMTDNLQCRERQRFVGHIADNILEEIEDQCGGSGMVVSFKLNGTF